MSSSRDAPSARVAHFGNRDAALKIATAHPKADSSSRRARKSGIQVEKFEGFPENRNASAGSNWRLTLDPGRHPQAAHMIRHWTR